MSSNVIRVAELFADVEGFRLGLNDYHDPQHPESDMSSASPFHTVWANQWESLGNESKRFAWRCYEKRFEAGSCANEGINKVLDAYENDDIDTPDVDMVVEGFPCQDYSVTKPLSKARGFGGKKGMLRWNIYRFLHLKEPRYVLLENASQLLKTPAPKRECDFAVTLSRLANLGYSAEWHVANSAECEFSQRRKRVYNYAELTPDACQHEDRMAYRALSSALPIIESDAFNEVDIPDNPYAITQTPNVSSKGKSLFGTAGAMQDFHVVTSNAVEDYQGQRKTLGDIRVPPKKYLKSFTSLRGNSRNGVISRARRARSEPRKASTALSSPTIILNAPWRSPTC